ncbi:hypothetical protein BDZ97DRAFT_1880774 [Flammula alnicola]|nr:hypothetical protein BDZ97DRAFT_1880774 [Flammula alnicola]
MAPTSTPAGSPDTSVAQSQASQPLSTSQVRRPLQREGAIILLSPAEQALEDAMSRSSPPPEQVLGKRTHEQDDEQEGGDTEPEEGTSATAQAQSLPPSLSNVTAATLRYATYKKLRTEQRDELEAFLRDTALGRQAKLFVCVLSVENKIDAFRSAAPPYQVSDELKTNVNNYAVAVLLSVNISAYKGDIPRNHILNILKRYRFDLPAGIEHDYSNWEKITASVSYSLTQTRARVRNLYRAIHQECNGGEKYWNLIDQRSRSNPAKRAFRDILKTDRETYSAGEDYEIGDVVADDWQQRVDDVVAGYSNVVS